MNTLEHTRMLLFSSSMSIKWGKNFKGDLRDLALAFKLTLFVLHTLANCMNVHTTTAGRSNAGKLFLKQYFHSIAIVVTSHEITRLKRLSVPSAS